VVEAVKAYFSGTPVRVVYVRREEVGEPPLGPSVEEAGLDPRVASALRSMGIERLYAYQYEAYVPD